MKILLSSVLRRTSQVVLVAKDPLGSARDMRTQVPPPGREDPLEKGKVAHSSILAWRIPWTVWSMELQRVRHD